MTSRAKPPELDKEKRRLIVQVCQVIYYTKKTEVGVLGFPLLY
jgi:hypothetical protein